MMKKVDFKPVSVAETNSSPLRMDGWLEYDPFLLGWPIFRGDLLVSGRVSSFTFLKSETGSFSIPMIPTEKITSASSQ